MSFGSQMTSYYIIFHGYSEFTIIKKTYAVGPWGFFLTKFGFSLIQGTLSVPGISGYEWVPARIGHFY